MYRALALIPAIALTVVLLLVPAIRGAGEPRLMLAAPLATNPIGTAFTYQGELKQSGGVVNGACDLQFALFDATTGGSQIGSTQNATPTLANGLFTVTLDFGAGAFQGAGRWLEIATRCPAGSGSFTTLSPRQAITPTPYALSLRPGTVVSNAGVSGFSKVVQVLAQSFGGGSAAVYGEMDGPSSVQLGTYAGVWGNSTDGSGVYGTSNTFYGVYGKTSTGDAGVVGQFGNTFFGLNTGEHAAVLGMNATGLGVVGATDLGGSDGVRGQSGAGASPSTGTGVHGIAYGTNGNGIVGEANSGGSAYGVWGKSTSGYAGYFNGNVTVVGNLSASGTKPFVIDHPLDPTNEYLYHYALESPRVQNVYDGTVTLDADGEAVAMLPSYFAAINAGEYQYQLTPIGASMPGLYVSQEVQGNSFGIAGGVPGKKVSWLLLSQRNDAWVRNHPAQDTVAKPPAERGTYLYPEGYGLPATASTSYAREQALRTGAAR